MKPRKKIQRKTPLTRKKPLQRSNTTPVKKISDKRAVEMKEYAKICDDLLSQKPDCQFKIAGICTGIATTVHHLKGRGKYYLVREFMIVGCLPCHEWAHKHPKEAMEAGLMLRRNDVHINFRKLKDEDALRSDLYPHADLHK
jgi:hypothetical protein